MPSARKSPITNAFEGRRVLVTGGCGFIGGHLCEALIASGALVRVLDNLSTGCQENLGSAANRVELQVGDIRNHVACRSACAGVETVFHLAAFVSAPASLVDPITADSINITGAMNLLLAAKEAGVQRIVFSSSAAIYGDAAALPAKESGAAEPQTPYGLAKWWAEQAGALWQANGGPEFVALRYFNVYGPRQNPHSEYAAVVPKFISALKAGKRPVIYGDGQQTRDLVNVADVVRANLLAATKDQAPVGSINVASGIETSIVDLLQVVCQACGAKFDPEYLPHRPGDILRSAANISRAKSLLGFSPTVSLKDGIAECVAAARR